MIFRSLAVAALCVVGSAAWAQTETALAFLERVKKQALAYSDQKISFTSVLDAPGRNGQRVQRKTSGEVWVKGESAKLVLQGQTFFFKSGVVTTVSPEDEEIVVRKLDGDAKQYTPAVLLSQYEKSSSFAWAGTQTVAGRSIKMVSMVPKNDPDVAKVILGVDAKTLKLYSYTEEGKNGTKSKITMVAYETNKGLTANDVEFKRSNYPANYEYIAPKTK
ncbi:MAG: outer membrane lipoprotein carrier protein LolA [Bacteroidetes bacterium]|nr:outer membrane lipoprotein carrier protein LolA [Bacteroidota bacterium]